MNTCVSYFLSFFLSLSNLSCLLWVWAKPGKEHIKNVLCGSRAEPSPSTSLPSKTDRHGGDTTELPSVGAGVKPGTAAPETFFFSFFCQSFFLFSTPPCLFSFAHFAFILLLPLITSHFLFHQPPLLSLLDLDVKASQAVWSLSAGCQGRDAAHWDPEWDKLTVTMFPLSMWSWEKEKVKRRADD